MDFSNRKYIGPFCFFINPQIIKNGKEILPPFWSDNYFSLPPDASTVATVRIPNSKINNGRPQLALSGCNVEKEVISLEK
jgi:hypothetical protein